MRRPAPGRRTGQRRIGARPGGGGARGAGKIKVVRSKEKTRSAFKFKFANAINSGLLHVRGNFVTLLQVACARARALV